MLQIFELCDVIMGKTEILKIREFRQSLNFEDIVIVKVDDFELFEFF